VTTEEQTADEYDDTIATPNQDGEPDQGDPNAPDVDDTPPARDHEPAPGAVDDEGRLLKADGTVAPPKNTGEVN
jgi:hypothetical protein